MLDFFSWIIENLKNQLEHKVLKYLDGKSLAVKYEVKYIETAPGDIFNRKILIFIKIDVLTIYREGITQLL